MATILVKIRMMLNKMIATVYGHMYVIIFIFIIQIIFDN
jgi:hypothetical protein